MSSRMPRAVCRSNFSAGLDSEKRQREPPWIGRSPLLATVNITDLRPLLSSISPSLMKYSPGITPASSNQVGDHGDLGDPGGDRGRAGNADGEPSAEARHHDGGDDADEVEEG